MTAEIINALYSRVFYSNSILNTNDYQTIANNSESVKIKQKITFSGNIAKKSYKIKTFRRKKWFFLSDFNKIQVNSNKKFVNKKELKNMEFYFPSFLVKHYTMNGEIRSKRYLTEHYRSISVQKLSTLKTLNKWFSSNLETCNYLEDLPQLWLENRLNALNYRIFYSNSILNTINDYEKEKVQHEEEDYNLPSTIKLTGLNFYNQKIRPAIHKSYVTKYSISPERRLAFLNLPRYKHFSLRLKTGGGFSTIVKETEWNDRSDGNGWGDYWYEETLSHGDGEDWLGFEKAGINVEKGMLSEGGPSLKTGREKIIIDNRIRNVGSSDDFLGLGPKLPKNQKKVGKYSAWRPGSFWYDHGWKHDLGPSMSEIYKFKKKQGFFNFSFIPKLRIFVPISTKWKNTRTIRGWRHRGMIWSAMEDWLSEFGMGRKSPFSEDISRFAQSSLLLKSNDSASFKERYTRFVFLTQKGPKIFNNLNYLLNKEVYRALLERSKSYNSSNLRLENIGALIEPPIERVIFGCKNYRDAQLIPMDSIVFADSLVTSQQQKKIQGGSFLSPWDQLEIFLRKKSNPLITKLEKKYDVNLIYLRNLGGKFHSLSQDIIPASANRLRSTLQTEDNLKNNERSPMCTQKSTVIIIPEFFGMKKSHLPVKMLKEEGFVYNIATKTKNVKVKMKVKLK